jgi:hypothetical protein
MHASLAITPDGLPLGLTPAKFWSPSKFKGTTALKRKINPTRVPIESKESMRWLDNLRLSTELTGVPHSFLVRSCVDRLAEDGDTTISKVMAAVQSSGTREVRFRDGRGKRQHAMVSIRYAT